MAGVKHIILGAFLFSLSLVFLRAQEKEEPSCRMDSSNVGTIETRRGGTW